MEEFADKKSSGWNFCCTSRHQETIKWQNELLGHVENLQSGLVRLDDDHDNFINTVLIDNSMPNQEAKTLVLMHGD